MREQAGSMMTFRADGELVQGYVSLPASGIGPGLIVLQEWWGLVDHIKSVADRCAAAGYVVLAPDLYRGEAAASPDDAKRLMMALDMPRTAAALGGAAEFLLAHDAVHPKKVGTMGFCMGGQLALYAASAHAELIDAVVDFYGVFNPAVPVDLSAITAPVLAHFGVHDSTIPRARADKLLRELTAAGVDNDGYFYEAGHAFFNDSRPSVYNEPAATLAWKRTLDFLADALT